MTIFANQTKNTVFAAPDDSSGQPGFRNLTANDVPSLIPPFVLTAQTANITNVYTTYFTSAMIPANTLSAGNTFAVNLISYVMATSPDRFSMNVHIGVNGNTTDPNVFYFMDGYFPTNSGYTNEIKMLVRNVVNGNANIVFTQYHENYTQSGLAQDNETLVFATVNVAQNNFISVGVWGANNNGDLPDSNSYFDFATIRQIT